MYLVVIEVAMDVAYDTATVTRIYTDDPTLKDSIGFLVKNVHSNIVETPEFEVEYDPDYVHHLVRDGGPY